MPGATSSRSTRSRPRIGASCGRRIRSSASTRRSAGAPCLSGTRDVRAPAQVGRARVRPAGPQVEPQEAAMADDQRDVIEVLEHDHREVEQMFSELESLRGASTEEAKSRRKVVTEQVTIELVRHSVAEE